MSAEPNKLAVLFDADNAQAAIAASLLAELGTMGNPSVKRAYGDWTTPHLSVWKGTLNALAIQPIQQFAYTTGKNATDAALIIDAMDILHANTVEGFCLVSSDSDFTRLATRIRETGVPVYGCGEKKTPEAFVAACDHFIFTESLKQTGCLETSPLPPDLESLIREAIKSHADERGWATLSGIGSFLVARNSDFDARDYGFRKLSDLLRSAGIAEVGKVSGSDGSANAALRARLLAH